jgi:hypothetical protein
MFGDLDAVRLSGVLGTIQQGIHYTARTAIAQELVKATNAVLPPELRGNPTGAYDAPTQLLMNRGIVELGRVFDAGQVETMLGYFRSRPCYAAHVAGKSDGVPRTIEQCAALGHYGSYSITDVLHAPFLPELANREDILALMEGYLGCPPTLYSVNAFWSFPDQQRPWPGIQTYHRDFDDFRFCTMFLTLTDFTVENGAHHYIPATHRREVVERAVAECNAADPSNPIDVQQLFTETASDLNDVCARLFPGKVQTVTGPAGSVMIEDTYGLHKGDIPKTPRLLVWIRYGLYKNLTNQRDNIVPLPPGTLSGRIPNTDRNMFL